MARIYKKVPVHVVKGKREELSPVKAADTVGYLKKVTHVRSELGEGQYIVTYYFRKGPYGELIAEDYKSATHFERAVYDENDNFIGSTIGTINDKVRW